MMFRSSGTGPDTRAIIEIEQATYKSGILTLAGTACAYEGNLLIEITDSADVREMTFTQASAAGPNRGSWLIKIERLAPPFQIRVGDEDAEAGGLFPPSVVHLYANRDGSITEVRQ